MADVDDDKYRSGLVHAGNEPVGQTGRDVIAQMKAYHPSWWPETPDSDPVGEATAGLLALIGQKESQNDPDAIGTPGWTPQMPLPPGQKPSDMTIRDLIDWQRQPENTLESVDVGNPKGRTVNHPAVGLLQFKPDTLAETAGKLGIMDQPFSPENQNRLGEALMNQMGLQNYLDGEDTDGTQFTVNMSKRWATVPKDPSGQSYYGKKAPISYPAWSDAISKIKQAHDASASAP